MAERGNVLWMSMTRRKLGRNGDVSGRSSASQPEPWRGSKPRKKRAINDWQRLLEATDQTVEQRHEVEGRHQRIELARKDGGGATTRWQGSQRCDAAAVWGTSSRGVKGAAGMAVVDQTQADFLRKASWRVEAAALKRGEPLPVSGCNKPGTFLRSKPSRWCKTTWAEQDWPVDSGWPKAMATSLGVDAVEEIG
jgi:hypothetical protein